MKKCFICIILSIFMLFSLMPMAWAYVGDSPVVIYETYVAGGYYSGNYAPYQDSYVVLYNNSAEDVDLTGWSLIYMERNSDDLLPENKISLSGYIYANRFYVIKLNPCSAASNPPEGIPLDFPMINISDTTVITNRSHGKFALCDDTIGSAQTVNSTDSFVVDFLGYGSPNDYLGAPNSGMSVKKILRRVSPIMPSTNNLTDFDVFDIEGYVNVVKYNTDSTLETLETNSTVLIYETYVAGGYASSSNPAPYQDSYVVLYNNSAENVDLTGWSLIYAERNSNLIEANNTVPLSGFIGAYRFYVIKLNPCSDATDPPTGDPLDFPMINISGTTVITNRSAGKFALCDDTAGSAQTVNSTDSFVVDFLGYGHANPTNSNYVDDFETAPNNDMSVKRILRRKPPVIDTNNNNQDFMMVDIANFTDIVYYDTHTTLEAIPVVQFSHTAGYYSNSFNLEITDDAGADIYYTTDGSDPTTSATRILYTGGIFIDDRTGSPTNLMNITGTTPALNSVASNGAYLWPPHTEVQVQGGDNYWIPMDPTAQENLFNSVFKINTIRATAENANGQFSNVITGSFIVSQKSQAERFSLPIVSITTDKDNLYNLDTGLFMNYDERGSDWQRNVYTEFFETDGSIAFEGNMGLRINGGFTRAYPQKSLRLYATGQPVAYDLFQGNAEKANGQTLTEFNRFILRSSGNDWLSSAIRDSLWHTYTGQLDTIDFQAYRPCIAFINGEFWGMYDIRERYDDYYFATHYDISRGDVALLEGVLAYSNNSTTNLPEPPSFFNPDVYLSEGKAQDLTDFITSRNHIIVEDMTDPDLYKHFLDEFDIDNYIDYMISVIFSGNTDWPHNNVKIWRNSGSYNHIDNRWRFLMVDADFAFPTSLGADHNTLAWAMGELETVVYSGGEMLKSLMENDEFKRKFSARFAYLLDNFFVSEKMVEHLENLQYAVTTAIPEHRERWNLDIARWYSTSTTIKNRMRERPSAMRKNLYQTLDTVIFSCDPEMGEMVVNGTNIHNESEERYSAALLSGETAEVSITPKEGYRYLGANFVSETGTLTFTSSTFTFTPPAGGMVTAIFEKDIEMTVDPLVDSKYLHTLVVNPAGDLYGWGYAASNRMAPLSGTVTKPAFIRNGIKKASAGNGHSAVIDLEDIVHTIGNDQYGKMGHDEAITDKVFLENGSPLLAREVIAGYDNSYAIGLDNTLYGWGRNNNRQIHNTNTITEIRLPYVIAENVLSAAAGNANLYYVTNDYELYSRGASSDGRLGRGTSTTQNALVAADVRAVFASETEAFYITNNNELYGFGRNSDGTDINGTLGTATSVNTPTLIDTNVSTASASRTHLLYIKNDGSVWGRGRNTDNQISQDNGTDIYLTSIKIAENGLSVSAGRGTSHILTPIGSVKVLGSTQYRDASHGLSEGGINTPMELMTVTPVTTSKLSGGIITTDFMNYTGVAHTLRIYDADYSSLSLLNLAITPVLFPANEEIVMGYQTKHSGGNNKVLIWDDLRPLLPAVGY